MVYGWLTRLAGVALAGLVAACQAASPGHAPEPATAAVPATADDPEDAAGSAATAIDGSQGDCLSQLRTLQQAAAEGRLGPDDQSAFVVDLVAPKGSWLDGVPDVPIEADLPLAVADGGPVDGARCVLRIGPAREQKAAHRAVDLQDVHSTYQSALRSERNPDYDAAQLRQRQARDQAKGGQKIVRTNDPLLDLIGSAVGGVIATFDQRSRRQALDAAAAELAATPRSRDKPVYRPYSFERVVVRAQKQALVPVALLDAQGQRLQAAELRQSERREFFVLRGLDPRDRDYEQHRTTSMTRADLARWARTPPVLRLSSVAIALTEGAPALQHPHEHPPDAEPDGWAAEDAPDADPLTWSDAQDAEPDPWPASNVPSVAPDPWLDEAFADKGSQDFADDDLAGPKSQPLPIAVASLASVEPGLDVADLVLGLGRGRPKGPAPAMPLGVHPSVVVVHARAATGFGFYVRDNLVLTTAALVGSISVVDVSSDGATVPALVAVTDSVRDLALLQVPRPGVPVLLPEGSAAPEPTAGPDPGPGYPLFDGDRLVGMTTAAGGHQGVIAIDAIRGFLDGQTGLLAAIP